MKKQRKKPAQKKKSQPQAVAAPKGPDRRKVLGWVRNGAIAAVILGLGGYWAVGSVRATMAEHDLARVGNGTPSIVQIHDPQCSLCLSLQSATREALAEMGDDEITYLVANIQTPDGRAFANQYGVPHVTLLLFDGQGELQDVLNGVRQPEALLPVFKELAGNPSTS